jgi:DNA topoisomerase-1
VLRDGMLGLFLASSAYPRERITRPPKVADLVRHRDELAEKFRYLADAPATDPKGRPVLVRFSRATKEHYLASETADGEASGWSMFLENGKWVEKAAEVSEKKKKK